MPPPALPEERRWESGCACPARRQCSSARPSGGSTTTPWRMARRSPRATTGPWRTGSRRYRSSLRKSRRQA
eukprot:1718237-Lingulodinium_polyedra.AAC.1